MKLNKLDYILLISMAHLEIWGVLFYLSWRTYHIEPTTLERVILPVSVIELILSAVIKVKRKDHTNESTDEEEGEG